MYFFYVCRKNFFFCIARILSDDHKAGIGYSKKTNNYSYIRCICLYDFFVMYGVSQELFCFPRIFKICDPFHAQHLASIGRSKNGHPIGVTVISCEDELFLRGIWKKTQFFFNTLYVLYTCLVL